MSDDNVTPFRGKKPGPAQAGAIGMIAQTGGIESVMDPRNPNDPSEALAKLAANGPGQPIGSGGLAGHASDCAIFNAPAYAPGACDCGHAER